jgi:hypothetical protein
MFFTTRDGPWCPTLRLVHKYPDMMKKLRVDTGAIKFVLAGADVMCPGLTSAGATIHDEVLHLRFLCVGHSSCYLLRTHSMPPINAVSNLCTGARHVFCCKERQGCSSARTAIRRYALVVCMFHLVHEADIHITRPRVEQFSNIALPRAHELQFTALIWNCRQHKGRRSQSTPIARKMH